MENIGVEFSKYLDFFLLVSLVLLLHKDFWFKRFGKRSKRVIKIINLIPILLFLPIFILYDLALRNLNQTSLFARFIALLQNWFPGEELFMDSNINVMQFTCSQRFNIYEPQDCMMSYNQPAIYKFLPSSLSNNFHFFVILVFIMLILIPIIMNLVFDVEPLILIIFLFSPSVFFLLDRANWESIAAFVLLIASLIFRLSVKENNGATKYLYMGLASVSIFCLTSVKYYGSFLGLAFFLFSKNISRLYWLMVGLGLVLFSIFVLELPAGLRNAPTPSTSSFGLLSIINRMKELSLIQLLVFIIFFFVFHKQFFNSMRKSWNLGSSNGRNLIENPLLPVLVVFVTSWLLTENVFYRAVLVAPYLIQRATLGGKSHYGLILFSLCFLSAFPLTANFACLLLALEMFGIISTYFHFSRISKGLNLKHPPSDRPLRF